MILLNHDSRETARAESTVRKGQIMLRVFCKTGSARLAAAVSLLTLASLTSFAWHSTFYVNTDWPPPCHVQSNQTYYFSTSAGRDSGDPSGAIIEQFIESSTNGAG